MSCLIENNSDDIEVQTTPPPTEQPITLPPVTVAEEADPKEGFSTANFMLILISPHPYFTWRPHPNFTRTLILLQFNLSFEYRMKSIAKVKRMEFTLIPIVINIMNVTTMVKRLSVFVHLDYFSVQIISTVIGRPMSFVLILALMIQQQHQTLQHLQQTLQLQRYMMIHHHQQHKHQRIQQLQQHHRGQLVVKLTRIFAKISQTVSTLRQTVPSIINVSTMV